MCVCVQACGHEPELVCVCVCGGEMEYKKERVARG